MDLLSTHMNFLAVALSQNRLSTPFPFTVSNTTSTNPFLYFVCASIYLCRQAVSFLFNYIDSFKKLLAYKSKSLKYFLNYFWRTTKDLIILWVANKLPENSTTHTWSHSNNNYNNNDIKQDNDGQKIPTENSIN